MCCLISGWLYERQYILHAVPTITQVPTYLFRDVLNSIPNRHIFDGHFLKSDPARYGAIQTGWRVSNMVINDRLNQIFGRYRSFISFLDIDVGVLEQFAFIPETYCNFMAFRDNTITHVPFKNCYPILRRGGDSRRCHSSLKNYFPIRPQQRCPFSVQQVPWACSVSRRKTLPGHIPQLKRCGT